MSQNSSGQRDKVYRGAMKRIGDSFTHIHLAFIIFTIWSGNVLSFSLKTSCLVKAPPDELFTFIATPTNWPSIVASSHSVRKSSIRNNNIDKPLMVGDCVEEIFGLPPLLPLTVVWECMVADKENGVLEFYSKDGVPNLAKECSMKFKISSSNNSNGTFDDTNVDLVMGYQAINPLVFAATPLLNLDNNLALKVLLPLAIERQKK